MSRPDPRELSLLSRLRQAAGQFVSGSELAELLGVSRAAVGKRVGSLRERGFEVEAVHNRGYRLVSEPDALEARSVLPRLSTRWLGRVYFHHQRLASSNDEVARLGHDGAPHGTVVVTEEQDGGRGRLGRGWHSEPGENLTFSALLRPSLDPLAIAPITLAVAVGVAEGVRGFVGRPPMVKWPNDLLYGGRKLCGILCELTAEAGQIKQLVIGVGLNVNASSFPASLTATSLRLERGAPVQRALVLVSVLAALERWLDRFQLEGPAPVLAAWTSYAEWLGQPITVSQGRQQLHGIALGLDRLGGLRLQLEDGTEQVVLAGDVEVPDEKPGNQEP